VPHRPHFSVKVIANCRGGSSGIVRRGCAIPSCRGRLRPAACRGPQAEAMTGRFQPRWRTTKATGRSFSVVRFAIPALGQATVGEKAV
jgi:hypothetical protein